MQGVWQLHLQFNRCQVLTTTQVRADPDVFAPHLATTRQSDDTYLATIESFSLTGVRGPHA